ncbi:response regulator [Stenomitos frigidus]|uniref:Response regulatory domain-containing protein n=1 Tax=Stenomitos frigidus ULC18 TaxID=2107698 RepID=A0A2T1EGN0_9CYAN|nr:response regulator [Stenomitos frigidus]PSB31896.1 hypothetical protein C7B82_06675 [Stenomitos frigidus ULC18]
MAAIPNMDGYMLLQQIRAQQHGSPMPAIALTAYAGELNQKQALAAGFQEHMLKPVETDKIVMAIANLLNRPPHLSLAANYGFNRYNSHRLERFYHQVAPLVTLILKAF